MQLHELQVNTKSATKKRVGRGGKRGKTSGRGHKGQKARAGGTPRPVLRDIIKKIPKLRGHGKNRSKTVDGSKEAVVPVSLSALDDAFISGGEVTPSTLLEKGVVNLEKGRFPRVKILANGDITKKLVVKGIAASESAKKAIEKAGGSVEK